MSLPQSFLEEIRKMREAAAKQLEAEKKAKAKKGVAQ